MRRRSALSAAAIGAGAPAFIWLARPWYLQWGSTGAETTESLPGDDLVSHPRLVATRAITIRASAGTVWPWIAQLGQGRGGFYSYDFLENLIGCDIHSANRVGQEWQDIRLGEEVKLAPEVPLHVAAVKRRQSLVLRGGVPIGNIRPPYDFSWAFVLREPSRGTTRLVVRERYAYTSWWAPFLVEPVEIVSFAMHRKMLRGIRDRAERAAAGEELNRELIASRTSGV